MTADLFERRFTPWLFAVVLVLGAWGTSVGWNHGFLPGNEFRQTHTALSTFFIQRENNFALAYPTPLLGKPWSVPYEFPLYEWSVVKVSNATGLGLTQSARAVSWLCFYLALPAIWLLLGQIDVAASRRLIVLGLIVTCPLYIFYSRAFLIETMALMFSLWFLTAYVSAVKRGHLGWLAVANLAGAGAGLVKVTTFMIYLVPAAVWSVVWLWQTRPQTATAGSWGAFFRNAGTMVAATAVPFAVTLWWIHLADRIKADNPSGRQLVSKVMNSYHFGSWDLRLSPELWQTFGRTLVTNLAPLITLVGFLFIAVSFGGRWRRWILACCVLFAAAPLTFPILYSLHEYYFAANGVLLMTAIGLSLASLLDSRLPRWLVWLAVLGVFAAQLSTYRSQLYPLQALKSDGGNGLTQLLRDATGEDDVLIIAGDDWAPMIPYYSQRRALMFRRGLDLDGDYISAAFANLKGEKVSVLILRHEARNNATLLQIAHSRFGLELEAIADWDDSKVYVLPTLRAQLVKQYHTIGYGGVVLTGSAAAAGDVYEFVERRVDSLPEAQHHIFDSFSPKPVRFSSRFALGGYTLDQRELLMAHPNSRLWIPAETGVRQVTAEFGIIPDAYERAKSREDEPEGTTFSIVRSHPDGTSETVFQRFIDPANHSEDRGTQKVSLSVRLAPGDELSLVTGPGPHGNFNRAWAYWASAQVR